MQALEGSCLRYPETIPPQREITYEIALGMLLKAAATAQTVPFTWGYVDKPADGAVLLLFLPQNNPYPNDGIRWQGNEIKAIFPAGPRELEVCEIKFGFVPASGETTASRLRRRYRLLKGGNSQLVLIHYTRGDGMMVPPTLANQPVRAYPLRAINAPGVYVAGEKQGQKVFPGAGGNVGGGNQGMGTGGTMAGMGQGMAMGGAGPSGMGMGNVSMHPSAATGIPGPGAGQGAPGAAGGPPIMVPSVGGTVGSGLPGGLPVSGGVGVGLPGGVPGVPGAGGAGIPGANIPGAGVGGPTSASSAMGLGMNLSNMSIHQQQALLAQQNSHMEALERRRERERAAVAAAAQQGTRPHRLPDEDDSGDEIDQISTRTIALARYKRNHDWMNQVFYHAAFGKMIPNNNDNSNATDGTGGGSDQSEPKPAYSIFTKAELETKITSLQTEIEMLQRTSAERRVEKIRAVQSQYQHQHQDAPVTLSAVGPGESIVV